MGATTKQLLPFFSAILNPICVKRAGTSRPERDVHLRHGRVLQPPSSRLPRGKMRFFPTRRFRHHSATRSLHEPSRLPFRVAREQRPHAGRSRSRARQHAQLDGEFGSLANFAKHPLQPNPTLNSLPFCRAAGKKGMTFFRSAHLPAGRLDARIARSKAQRRM